MESEMARTHHLSMIGAVIVCLVCAQGNGTLFASAPGGRAPAISIDEQPAGTDLSSTPLLQMERSRFTLDAGFFASNPPLGPEAQGAHRTFNLVPTQSSAFDGQVYQGRPYRMGRDRSVAAIMLGAVVTITGAAILVYANRPECSTNQFAGGCGYGTKVVGGAVLSGGVVGLFVGALTWR
jgi:hypothetical protein